MKKLTILFAAIFGLFMLNACDEDLLDVTDTFEFEEEFIVDTNVTSFAASHLIDLSEDVDLIDEYGDKIKEVVITKADFWIKELVEVEGQTLDSGSLFVSNPDGSNKTAIVLMGEYVLADLVNNPTALNLEQAGIDKLDDLATNPPHQFMLHYEADFNEAPLDFTVVFEFEAKMVANPLN
jgi:hypothetical protein